ncbi:MAG: alkylation response protein AidB-like acyl-CoA dehydrogenase [Gammaproteobacteria bacterium]|jgi:alkylation response protein AidB-like acyl-CoA dehydrogenase
MDLSYGTVYETFREEVRSFLQEHGHEAPTNQRDYRSDKALAWQERLIKQGYTARTIPKKYGGAGAEPDILKTRIIADEFAAAKVTSGIGGQGIAMLVPTLLELGTEAQRSEIIPPTLRGELFWCQGYSEPDAGSDLASLRTNAYLDGDEWVINGSKIWTSSAHFADWMFCLVRTEPDAPKHDGISFLLFRMDTPGIDVRALHDMTETRNFNEVFFTDVRVPAGQIIGERGQGWRVANTILGHERELLGDPNMALTRLNNLIQLMRTETIDGRRISDMPVFRDRVMRIQGKVMAMRFNDLRLLSAKINQQSAPLARMVVKLQGTELRHELEKLAVDVMGEFGLAYGDNEYLRGDGLWQWNYMYYLGLIIGGGTSQIQKNIISERGLNMPKEPKVVATAGNA